LPTTTGEAYAEAQTKTGRFEMTKSPDVVVPAASEAAGGESVASRPGPPVGASVAAGIHVLIGRVLKDLPAVGKGSQAPASMGNYSFRGIDDTLNALNPILSKHGVFFIPIVEKRRDSDRQTGKGGTLWMVSLRVRYRFYGPNGDYLDAVVEGEGSDSGDKATQKALTAAMKYMLFQVFAISTKEVGEMDAERHDVPESSPRQPQESRPRRRSEHGAVTGLHAQFIASARKAGVVIEPSYIANMDTDELNDLWGEIKAGDHDGKVLKAPQDAPGDEKPANPLSVLPEGLETMVRDKRGVFAAGWFAEFMQKKGRLVPTPEDLKEIEEACR
jgi:ERF superfamily